MHVLLNLIVVLQMLAALVMIGLVLIQHGKGADMGASFGSGASGSLFGATGSANFLSRTTAVCAAIFFACTLALAFMSNDRPRETGTSALDRPAAGAPAASAPLPQGATQIPGTAPGAAPAAPTTTAPAAPAAPAPQASGVAAIPTK